MSYSEDEIKKYLDIIHNFTQSIEKETDRRTKCWNCQESEFDLVSGFKICENCGCQNEHVLGYFDKRDEDQLIFRKKSVYNRKYHYDKKVDQVSKMIQLSEDEKYDLFNNLMEIDENVMEKLNKQFNRKRMISIVFLIKKILEEKGNDKYKLINLNTSHQTLVFYKKWWHSFKSLKQPLCENTSK